MKQFTWKVTDLVLENTNTEQYSIRITMNREQQCGLREAMSTHLCEMSQFGCCKGVSCVKTSKSAMA